MTILNEKDSVLIIIDIQEKLLKAVFNKDSLEKNALIITQACSLLDIPIIITEQYPKGLGSTIECINNICSDRAKIFEKTSFSALGNPDLRKSLKELNKHQIVIMGIETHICVSQTTNSLTEAGYDVNLISNACGSRNEAEHNYGIERIKENGGHIITTEIALFEWLKNSKHDKFKEIQALIK